MANQQTLDSILFSKAAMYLFSKMMTRNTTCIKELLVHVWVYFFCWFNVARMNTFSKHVSLLDLQKARCYIFESWLDGRKAKLYRKRQLS